MSELSWDWPEIACVLVQKLAPQGVVITRKDLARLPMDRVFIVDREETVIRFRWLRPEDARNLSKRIKEKTGTKAGVSQLQGRWMKLATVLLWKLAKDGCVIGQLDRAQVPADKVLLAHGHAEDLEYRFVPRAEAARIQAWERENEGKQILEVIQ